VRTQLQEQLRAWLWVQPSLGLPPVSQGGAADRFGTPAGRPVWEQVAERVRLAVVDEVSARLGSPAWQTLRRVVERYGPGRYLRHAGAERVSHDDTGTRWRVGVGGERLVVVEVGNRTPAPDGSHRRSWLRVPPWVHTAREAVAWTFGLGADSYRPRIET
jgi:hypothetical protein